jgi:hypothetical protein
MSPKGPPIPPSMRRGIIRREPEPDEIFVSDTPINMSQADLGENRRDTTTDFLESGSAGRSTIINPGGVNAAWQSLISVRTEDRRSIPLTVTLSNYLSGNSNIAVILGPRGGLEAKLAWGAGAGSAEAVIDFMNGCIFTLVCSSLEIAIRNTYPAGVANQNVFNLAAFLSKGPKGSGHNPQRTMSMVLSTDANSAIIGAGLRTAAISIPFFARTFTIRRSMSGIFSASKYAPAFMLIVEDGNNGIIDTVMVGRNQVCPVIPISNSAITCWVRNVDVNSLENPQAIFDLAI